MGDAARSLPPGFDGWAADEQIDYVHELWSRIMARPERVPVPEWHRKVVEERLDDMERNPDASVPWDEAREQLLLKYSPED